MRFLHDNAIQINVSMLTAMMASFDEHGCRILQQQQKALYRSAFRVEARNLKKQKRVAQRDFVFGFIIRKIWFRVFN